MTTQEIKVNGCLIGHLHCVNVCKYCAPKKADNVHFDHLIMEIVPEHDCLYEWTYQQIGRGQTHSGEVEHRREDGAEELIKLIWEKMP